MQKIKNIVIHSIRLGYIEEAEHILRDLVDAQCQEMGLLHDDTLDSIRMWTETLALLEQWDHLAEVHELLLSAQQSVQDLALGNIIEQIGTLRTFERKTS